MARPIDPEVWIRYRMIEQEFAAGVRQSEIALRHNISRDYVKQIVHKIRAADKQKMSAQSNTAKDFAPVMRSVPVVRKQPRVEAAPKPVRTVFRMGCMTGADPLADVRKRQVQEGRRGRI